VQIYVLAFLYAIMMLLIDIIDYLKVDIDYLKFMKLYEDNRS